MVSVKWKEEGGMLSRWHPGFGSVSINTKVYFVGEAVKSIEHICNGTTLKIPLVQPTHTDSVTAYCKQCDMLWIGKEKMDVGSV